MTRSGGARSLASSPVMVGALTVLIATVAVFLAYNSNEGLPFVPTRTLKVELRDAAKLSRGDEVRRGGSRIGRVSELHVASTPHGTVAVATLELDESHGDVPVDSRFTVRARSLLGAKYVDIARGHSPQLYADGATVPVTRSRVPVQLDDVTSTFDEPTRTNLRRVLTGLGDGLAGRGVDLNETLGTLPELLPHLERVAGTLAAPGTHLPQLIAALDRTAAALAPVAERQAHLFRVAAITFAAFVRDPDALRDTIAETPPTLAVATPALRAQRPFLEHAAALAGPLDRSATELDRALPDLDAAVRTGTPLNARVPAFGKELTGTFDSVTRLARDPGTSRALNGLTATAKTLNPQVRYLGPFITVCNYWNFFWPTAADAASSPTSTGQGFRVINEVAPEQQNGYGSQGATRMANGVNGGTLPGTPVAFYHGQPNGAAVNADGTADCEAAQRGYPSRLASFAAPDLNVVMDAHTPGSQGPVFRSLDDLGKEHRKLGVSRVPRGETFTRSPQTGPQLPPEPEGGP